MTFKKVLKISTVVFVTYILLELVCFIFIKIKFTSAHFPTFSFQYNYKKYDFPIAEINPVWGSWHYKETYTEKKQCFESVFHINNYGARDRERVKEGDTNRILFLGDSFIEGYGLNVEERLSDRLEHALQKEVLNFGCGYFTPTQEYLVYKDLAKNFSHNTIVIGILPFNDLAEDDTSFHEKDKFIHYQPYFQGNYPDYNLLYRESDLSKSTFNKAGYYALQNSTRSRLTRILKEGSFWYNIYQFIKSNKPAENISGKPYSGYYDYTKSQSDKLKYILEKLKEEAAGKKVIVVLIPVKNDLLRFNGEIPGLSKEMAAFCYAKQLQFIDLLPAFDEQSPYPGDWYLTCDGHWNAAANKKAAEILLPLLRK